MTGLYKKEGVDSSMHSSTQTMSATAGGIKFRGIEKYYGDAHVLKHFELDASPGEFISLLGPSGCGKTTALRVLAGLEDVESGDIEIDGQRINEVPTYRRDLGMVFQAYSLFPHLSALDNTMFGLRMRHIARGEAQRRAEEMLDVVGLGGYGNRFAHQLSGGQQQRVALARALVTGPKVLLLDEPLSALDARVRVQLRDEIRRIQRQLGITTVFVTHDQEEALAISDRVAVMNGGKIEQIGTPEDLYRRPATAMVAGFIGNSSKLNAVVRGSVADVMGFTLPLISRVPDGRTEVFVRPENVRLAAAGETAITATVIDSVFLGAQRRSKLQIDGENELWIQHRASEPLTIGDRVDVVIEQVPVVAVRRDESVA